MVGLCRFTPAHSCGWRPCWLTKCSSAVLTAHFPVSPSWISISLHLQQLSPPVSFSQLVQHAEKASDWLKPVRRVCECASSASALIQARNHICHPPAQCRHSNQSGWRGSWSKWEKKDKRKEVKCCSALETWKWQWRVFSGLWQRLFTGVERPASRCAAVLSCNDAANNPSSSTMTTLGSRDSFQLVFKGNGFVNSLLAEVLIANSSFHKQRNWDN